MNFLIGVIVLLAFTINLAIGMNIKKTDITVVNDETRYTTLNPNATYRAFRKVNHVKGNIIFTSGERIDGDRLILTFIDELTFTRSTDVEVLLWYPAEGHDGLIISCIEFVTALNTDAAEVFIVNEGGPGTTYAHILMAANKTFDYGYQMFLYGY